METATPSSTKLRFAIIIDGLAAPRWTVRCLAQLDRSGLASLALVIDLSPAVLPPKTSRPDWLLDKYRRWIRLRSPSLRAVKNLPLSTGAAVIRCLPEVDAGGFALNPTDVIRVRQSGLDFILHFSRHILRGAICDAARHGLWTFSHEQQDRHGDLAGFGEVMRGDAVTSTALQRLCSNGSTIDLFRGFLRTKSAYRDNAEALRLASAGWCVQVCKRIGLGQRLETETTAAPAVRLANMPTRRCMIRYFARRAGTAGTELWRKLFFLDMWNIGLVASPLRQVVATGQAEPVSWLRRPGKLRFFADPFVAKVQRRLYILFEEFDHLRGKGWISGGALQGDLEISARPIFAPLWHMSYPFLFEAEGKLFCVPETSEAAVVLLYEASSFPYLWKKPAVIVDGISALDSTVFAYEGRWWLFCTNGAASPQEELHAWYSEKLRGPWHPHPLNPLSCDVRSARPAGVPFLLDGALMRPGQDCSQTYGGAVSLMRVDTLTPTDFRETRIGAILPNTAGPYPDGLHTVVGMGDITIIDGKRRMFSPIALPLKLLSKLRKTRRLARVKRSRGILSTNPD